MVFAQEEMVGYCQCNATKLAQDIIKGANKRRQGIAGYQKAEVHKPKKP
jgi:hypothetical protein